MADHFGANSGPALAAEIETIKAKHESLEMENEMLADFLMRHFPSIVEDSGAQSPAEVKKKKSKAASLSVAERNAIATSEIANLTTEIESTKTVAEENLDALRSLMEETNIRISEIKREAYEFRREVLSGQKVSAEKLLKMLEDNLATKETGLHKLLQKNSILIASIRRVEYQLRRSEKGEDLKYIDFHQLQIENQQYAARIAELAKEMMKVKTSSAKRMSELEFMKTRLSQVEKLTNDLEHETTEKLNSISRIEKEIDKFKTSKMQHRSEGKKLRAIQHQIQMQSSQESSLPQVIDYIGQKQEEKRLEHYMKTLELRSDLATNDLKQASKAAKVAAP